MNRVYGGENKPLVALVYPSITKPPNKWNAKICKLAKLPA